MNIIKLLAYSHYLKNCYLNTFSKLPWNEVVKDRGASFGSLRNILLHVISYEDLLVNHLLQGDTQEPVINFEDFDSIEKIKQYMELVNSGVNEYLDTVTIEELSRKVERRFKDGTILLLTVEDVLIHLFQEGIHHMGEFIALLWQMDIEPPHLGWAKYINKPPS